MKNIIYTMLAIAFCLGLGKLVNFYFAGLPGSLYGMILYCLLLQLGWISAEKISQTNHWIIRHMGICFIPAAVGVINHFELIKHHGLTIMLSIVFTTFILISFVGIFAERYLTQPAKDKSSP